MEAGVALLDGPCVAAIPGLTTAAETQAAVAALGGTATAAGSVPVVIVVAVPAAAAGFVGADIYQVIQIHNLNRTTAQSQTELQQRIQKYTEKKAYKRRCTETPPPGLDPCELAKWKLQQRKDCYLMRFAFGQKWFNDGFQGKVEEMQNLLQAIKNAEEEVKKNCPPDPCPPTK